MELISNEEKESVNQHFKYIKYIGQGAYGKVVKAYDSLSKEHIAVKIIEKNNNISKVFKEGNILYSLKHPNIVKYKGIKETENYILLCMELMKGGTLGRLIQKRKFKNRPFDEQEVQRIMKILFEAIYYLHCQNIVHRDIKPGDLGLAVSKSGSQVLNQGAGTLIYMAPEQVDQNKSYSKAVDIYSLGIIMFILIAGNHPLFIKGDTKKSYIYKLNNPQ